ncbi:MAG: FtsQ-type POTRA domain-containing protein [Verrucomicrobiota bacterium]|nr:FtsQ-type POTRA domain-containing protein [Verrucomicrobiota bacterium]
MIGGGKQKGSTSAGSKQSWRTLSGIRPIKSPGLEKRRRAKIFLLLALIFILFSAFVGIVLSALYLKNRGEYFKITAPSKSIEKIIFETDGVLPNSWLGTVIELRRNTSIMGADIHVMKQQLEAHRQVKSASIERQFPNILKVSIKEYDPVMRMRVMGPNDQTELRIVSRSGTIYKGEGYTEAKLKELPYLQPYQNYEGGLKQIRGIEQVAELLDLTRRSRPNFYKSLKVVSLEDYSGYPEMLGDVIEFRTTIVPRVIFGLKTDFAQQLDRMGLILQYLESRDNPALKRIDLSLQDSAAVQFENGRIRN